MATSRFVLVANAYVELGVTRAAPARTAPPDVAPRGPVLLQALARCSEDACAQAALGGAPADAREVADFLQSAWPARATRMRPSMERAASLLSQGEDVVGVEVAKDLAVRFPDDAVRLFVTTAALPGRGAADEPERVDPWNDTVIDAAGECFDGAAMLECAFARAVHDAQDQSVMLGAVERTRATLSDGGKDATKNLARALAMFAIGGAVHRVSHAYVPGRHFGAVRRDDEAAREWLVHAWDTRGVGDDAAAAFGERAARELGAGGAASGP
jgi:hypothetical protein